MMRTTKAFRQTCLFLLLAGLVPACGGGRDDSIGGGGGTPPPVLPLLPAATAEVEPNDLVADAQVVAVGGAGSGTVATLGDVDYWKFTTTAPNTVLQIEVYALRTNQAAWNTAVNTPNVQILGTDGTTVLYADNDRNAGDPDFPGALFPSAGTYYLRITTDAAAAGGPYSFRITETVVATQTEAETLLGVTNDTPATAEALVGSSGVLTGYHLTGTVDVYSITLAANSWLDLTTYCDRNQFQPAAAFNISVVLIATDQTTVLATSDDGAGEADSRMMYGITTAGLYYLRIQLTAVPATPDPSASYAFSWNVTAFGTAETEPNDASGTATPIVYGSIYTGALSSVADIDLYAFTGAAGDQVAVEMLDGSFKLQNGASDVTVQLTASDGTTAIPQSSFADTDPNNLNVVVAILQGAGTYHVRVTGLLTTNYAFRVRRVRQSTAETEPNDTAATASPLVPAGSWGVISAPGDVDYYSFTATAGDQVVLRALAAPPAGLIQDAYDGNGSTLAPILRLYGTDGVTLISSSDSTVTPRAQGLVDGAVTVEIVFVAPSTGTFFVSVASFDVAVGGPTEFYLVYRQ